MGRRPAPQSPERGPAAPPPAAKGDAPAGGSSADDDGPATGIREPQEKKDEDAAVDDDVTADPTASDDYRGETTIGGGGGGRPRDDEPSPSAASSSSSEAPVTVTKAKKDGDDDNPAMEENATPTTCNETMSTISPSALLDSAPPSSRPSEPPSSDDRRQRQHQQHRRQHVYHTQQRPTWHHHASQQHDVTPVPPPPPSSSSNSYHSHGSFSAITNPQSASAYYASAPPPPGSGYKGGGGRHAYNPNNAGNGGGPMSPYVTYQYQHYDPRSHVDVPAPPKRQGTTGGGGTLLMPPSGGASAVDPYGYGGGAVPPTVHMPGAGGGPIKDISPLTIAKKRTSTTTTTTVVHDNGSRAVVHHPPQPATMTARAVDSSGAMIPSTPRGRASPQESEAANAIAELRGDGRGVHHHHRLGRTHGGGGGNKPAGSKSPLDLLSSVSTSPVAPPGRNRMGMRASYPPPPPPNPHHRNEGRVHRTGGYGYPPAPTAVSMTYPGHARAPRRSMDEDDHRGEGRRADNPRCTSPPATHPTMASTPAPKSSSLVDLVLSAANTIDNNDESRANKRRRLVTEADLEGAADITRKLALKQHHSKAPAAAATAHTANLFSVGGYPPGFDPTTLPPSRSSLKPAARAGKARSIDSRSVAQARKASLLANQALERPRVGKQLLLSMALVRTNPRTPPSCYPAHGTILTDRFHWAAFPPLDAVLRRNMKRYYELSTNKCQSRDQQEFNNELVIRVREEASRFGWEFDDKAFDDKKIRDRIRCFFKTHIQNAKKRLKTMLRNPEKRANIKALAAHFHLIEEKGTGADDDEEEDSEGDDDGEGRNGGGGGLDFGLGQSYSTESEIVPHDKAAYRNGDRRGRHNNNGGRSSFGGSINDHSMTEV